MDDEEKVALQNVITLLREVIYCLDESPYFEYEDKNRFNTAYESFDKFTDKNFSGLRKVKSTEGELDG